MFKPVTIGYYKQVRNNPRCVAKADLLAGMAVTIDEAEREAKLPTTDTAKGDLWIVSNIIDKPEIRNKDDFKINSGEYVRADLLADARELLIELDSSVIKDTSVEVGDTLVANSNGKWEVKADIAGYKIYLEVIELSTFGGSGVVALVKVAD